MKFFDAYSKKNYYGCDFKGNGLLKILHPFNLYSLSPWRDIVIAKMFT